MDGQNQKREFTFPKKEDLIELIKELDDEIQHVSLNLIKCDFNATQKDVEKTFPEYKFIKIKNYNPGSFEVIFDMKIDAIHFIKNCYDRKILNRRFFIKMGRQNKEVIEDWACIGQVPKKFNKNYNKNNNYKKNNQNKKKIDEDKKDQEKTQEQKQEKKQEKKPKRQYKKDKQEKTQKKPEQKKEKKEKAPEKVEKEKPVQEEQITKEQKKDDDEWIVVGKTNKKKK